MLQNHSLCLTWARWLGRTSIWISDALVLVTMKAQSKLLLLWICSGNQSCMSNVYLWGSWWPKSCLWHCKAARLKILYVSHHYTSPRADDDVEIEASGCSFHNGRSMRPLVLHDSSLMMPPCWWPPLVRPYAGQRCLQVLFALCISQILLFSFADKRGPFKSYGKENRQRNK